MTSRECRTVHGPDGYVTVVWKRQAMGPAAGSSIEDAVVEIAKRLRGTRRRWRRRVRVFPSR